MDLERQSKRKKDKNEEDIDRRKEKKSKRARTRSRSPENRYEKDYKRPSKRSRSRSNNGPSRRDKQIGTEKNETEIKREVPERRTKETDMLNTRTGGAYIPPARLRMMQAQITDKSSIAYQRLAWEALKKSIHGHINKVNVGNIGIIIKELLKENIVRGRGLLCRSVIQAQAASPTFTNVYAALVAAVNSRFPNIGELLLKRLVIQFKRGFKRNDKSICISSASFVAHLVNQRVAHEILALELLTLLVETPTDDSVEVAIAFLKECGQKLTEVSSKGVNAIFEMLRNILHEGQLDKRVQYMIEVMFQVWKDGFKDHPALIEELELVPEEEQFTHLLMLDEATDPQDILNVFKLDDKYEENEQKYKTLSKEILGSDAESGEDDGSEGSGSEEESDEDDEDENSEQKGVTIIDNTETNLVALRRTIYLTINSSLDFEECAHKLMKMQLKPGQEVELCHMFLDCCAEQRTYEKFYGLLAQRFCNINRMYIGPFEEIFKDSYATAHRLDTNRLRNVSKFFAHLLFTDSISWEVLECVKLNEEDTTSSSRIYIKILFQELAEYMGLKKLNDRLRDPTLQGAFSGVFPRDNPRNTRFSINFFTSIGLGGLTDELREHLKQMPKNVPPPVTDIKLDSDSSSESSSSSSSDSSSSDSSSSSESEQEDGKKEKKQDKSQSKKKSKDKTPKTPPDDKSCDKEKTERWGHDGFYDTYGRDAKRNEPQSHRRDEENFLRPRENRQDRSKHDWSRNGNQRQRNGAEDKNQREDSNQRLRLEETNDRRRNTERNSKSNYETDRSDYKNNRDDTRRDRDREEDDRNRKNDRRHDRRDKEEDRSSRSDGRENKRDRGREDESRKVDRRDREDRNSKNNRKNKNYRDQEDKSDETERKEIVSDRGRKSKAENGEERYCEKEKSPDENRRYKENTGDRYWGHAETTREERCRNEDDRDQENDRKKDNYREEKDRNRGHSNKKRDKKSKRRSKDESDEESRNGSSSSEDSDSDGGGKRKSNRKKSSKKKDGWDIRGMSIQKEIPSYWSSYDANKRGETAERSPETSKNRDRRQRS